MSLGAPAYLPEAYAGDKGTLNIKATVHVEAMPDDGLEGLSDELMAKRVQKLLAYNDQYKPAAQLREEGWAVPQDYRGPDGGPLPVHDNSVEPISDWAW